jgi:TPP-dependent 2-oxoacid decarboxylase
VSVSLTIGDFNLAFLDLIDQVDDLKWSGNCNELNAAYSADGTASGASRTNLIKATLESQTPLAVLLRHLGIIP